MIIFSQSGSGAEATGNNSANGGKTQFSKTVQHSKKLHCIRPIYTYILILVLLVAGVITAVFMYSVHTINVPGDYPTIQAAIDAASDGEVIVVEPGVYLENINFNGKNITLRSTNPDSSEVVAATIIGGNGEGSVVTFNSGENKSAVLTGFTITGGIGTLLTIDYQEEGTQVIKEGFFGGGILILNESAPTIVSNSVQDNQCTGEGGGIAVWGASASIKSNKIIFNRAENGGGIYVGGNSHASINNNTVEDNSAVNGGGIYVGANSSATLEDNNIINNKAEFAGTP